MEVYRNFNTNEIVLKEDAEEYVLNKLGITIVPQGTNGELTQKQIENIEETVEWYFSDNWYLDNIEEDDEEYNIDLIKQDMLYDYYKDEQIGL